MGITIAVGIKVTAAMALAFLAIALARRIGGRWPDLLPSRSAARGRSVVTFAALTLAAGSGLGWIHALSAPGSVRSYLSLSTTLGVGAGQIGLLLGLGDHSLGTIDVMQPLGTAVGAALAVFVMWRCWQRHLNRSRALA